jgi:hypothetical protein
MGRTVNVRERLPWLVQRIGVRSLLDAGCGDYHWLQTVRLDVDYMGVDIVRELVDTLEAEHSGERHHFAVADITCDQLPCCDAILCRTVLFHLSDAHISAALANFKRSGAEWLLTTSYPWHFPNVDIRDGGWRRLNLQAAPFNLPSPWLLLPEDEVDPSAPMNPGYLSVWRLQR